MKYQLNLREIVYALSHALDFVGVDDVFHGKRVALISFDCAEILGWSPVLKEVILHSGLLHDCGVSTTGEHRHLINELEWSDSQAHALRGSQYLSEIKELSHLSQIVLYHHTRWEDLQKINIDDTIKNQANLIFLTDRLDALRAQEMNLGNNMLQQKEKVMGILKKYSGTFFNPVLLEAMEEVSRQEAFWFSLEPEIISVKFDLLKSEGDTVNLEFESLRRISDIFSRIIDAKSPHTRDHSRGVARLSCLLGERMQLDDETCNLLEIAGLLHDLGKLRVPDSILDKPDKLSIEERFQIARHSYDTYQVLKAAFRDTRIPEWASFHHESLTGDGYPFRRKGKELCLESRIVAIADNYQALAQNRPYRKAMQHGEIMKILNQKVSDKILDPEIVEQISKNPEETYRVAIGA